MPCPNRKSVKTYLTPEEYAQVAAMAAQTGLSISTFLKRVGLGQELRTKTDHEAVLALLKANADLGRLGGLFKMALSEGTAGKWSDEFRATLRQIEQGQAKVIAACRDVASSLRRK